MMVEVRGLSKSKIEMADSLSSLSEKTRGSDYLQM